MNVKLLKNKDISWEETRSRMYIVKRAVWAAKKGFSNSAVTRVLHGVYPDHTPMYQAIVQALQDDGFLVLNSDQLAV